MNQILSGKRILVTQASSFMGPTLCEVLAQHGAIVIANTEPLAEVGAAQAMVNAAGVVDVLVANLAISAPTSLATEASESEWRDTFCSPRRSSAKAVPRGPPTNDRTTSWKDSGHWQRLGVARHKAHFYLQRCARSAARVCPVRRRRNGATQRSSECDRAELCREPHVLSRRSSGQSALPRKTQARGAARSAGERK